MPPGAPLTAAFDWRQEGGQSWNILVETAKGQRLAPTHGGSKLLLDGQLAVEAPMAEYQAIYARFAALLASGASDVDATPLQLVADAFLVGRRTGVAAFDW